MSDFVAFFPSRECLQVPASFPKLDGILRGPLRADNVQSNVVHGAPILLSTSFARSPRFYAKQDGSGWIVVKGVVFDVHSKTATVDLEQLLDQFLAEGPGDLNRYEGTFALAAWDARKAQGWAVNDQASILNLYYGEHDGGLYVATHALTLARALGLHLDPYGLLEFLMRAVSFAPSTLFAGLQRVNVGEHIHYRAGKLSRGRHWYGYAPQARYRDVDEAAQAAAAIVVDRLSRYAAVASPVISDLTGGLDTRLLASAADATGLDLSVTVNGLPESEDVRIAHQVAELLGFEIRYFDTGAIWTVDITPDLRQELTYRTSGELPFTEIYHHWLTRPSLGKDFNLLTIGTGGDFCRPFSWEGSWKMKRRAFAVVRLPPPRLFAYDSISCFYSRFLPRIEAVEREQPGASLTQRLDAAFIWKMTSHCALYLSAMHNWLPSTAPLMTGGALKTAIAMPWTMRVARQLQRHIICQLSPRAAKVESWHSASHTLRGTAEPSIKNAGFEIKRYLGRFARSVDRRLLGGLVTKRSPAKAPHTDGPVPFLTPEFRDFLDPKAMFSRGLYTTDGLQLALSTDDAEWQARNSLIVRLATVEQLCRELDFRPEPNFWAPVMAAEAL
jgi:hypothetical protein